MGVFSRLSDIINSNLSAILDHAEDPEKLIRLMILEMESTLVDVRRNAAKGIADRKDVHRQLGRMEKAEAEWQRKAELALSKDREDLAKGALLEKSRLTEAAGHLQEELNHLDDALDRHGDDIAKLEAKLREAKAKQKAMTARQETATSRVQVRRNLHDGRIEEAFARFEHMEKRIDTIESEAEAYDLGQGKTLAEEIEELESDDAVVEELESLKAKLKKSAAAPTKPSGGDQDKTEASA